jgi:hypothetical protein
LRRGSCVEPNGTLAFLEPGILPALTTVGLLKLDSGCNIAAGQHMALDGPSSAMARAAYSADSSGGQNFGRAAETAVICASTTGNFTSFGGTRRSSQGDISATARVGSPSKSSCNDLLHPGGARLAVGGNHDVVSTKL